MAQDLWRTSIAELMQNKANVRAGHYRQQATRLRELAEMETSQKVRADLLDLAGNYEALAGSVEAQC
jgi:hypothetical protein